MKAALTQKGYVLRLYNTTNCGMSTNGSRYHENWRHICEAPRDKNKTTSHGSNPSKASHMLCGYGSQGQGFETIGAKTKLQKVLVNQLQNSFFGIECLSQHLTSTIITTRLKTCISTNAKVKLARTMIQDAAHRFALPKLYWALCLS